MDEWIKKETLPFMTSWMELVCIVLSEIRHTEKDKYDISYMWIPKK